MRGQPGGGGGRRRRGSPALACRGGVGAARRPRPPVEDHRRGQSPPGACGSQGDQPCGSAVGDGRVKTAAVTRRCRVHASRRRCRPRRRPRRRVCSARPRRRGPCPRRRAAPTSRPTTLARRRVEPAGAPAAPPTSRRWGSTAHARRLRLRPVGRRADRHPVHGRRRVDAAGAGELRLRRRERPRAVPDPPDAPIEGGPQADGDRHVLVVERDACCLYELFDAHPNGDGSWHAGSGAVWDLRVERAAPADAGPRPTPPACRSCPGSSATTRWPPGRSTTPSASPRTRRRTSYLWPAPHEAGDDDPTLPPMGLRLRLRADVDIAGSRPTCR